MKICTHLLVIISLMLTSCKKEEIDYRINYIGDFDFTVIRQFWQMGDPWINNYDTILYHGSIRKFVYGDQDIDLHWGNTSPQHPVDTSNMDRRITITFLDNSIITPEINKDGKFVEDRSGYHYHHAGEFLSHDELEFVVDGLGGLGSGINYRIRGTRN